MLKSIEHENGFLDYEISFNDGIKVISIKVEEEFRRKGIGSKLLQALILMYPNRNIKVRLENYTKELINFYKKNGFQWVREEMWRISNNV